MLRSFRPFIYSAGFHCHFYSSGSQVRNSCLDRMIMLVLPSLLSHLWIKSEDSRLKTEDGAGRGQYFENHWFSDTWGNLSVEECYLNPGQSSLCVLGGFVLDPQVPYGNSVAQGLQLQYRIQIQDTDTILYPQVSHPRIQTNWLNQIQPVGLYFGWTCMCKICEWEGQTVSWWWDPSV